MIGFPIVILAFVFAFSVKPFAWSDYIITMNVLVAIPFMIFSYLTLKNLKEIKDKQIQMLHLFIVGILLLPALSIPFVFNWYEMIFWGIGITVGIWAIFKIQQPLHILLFINLISLTVLVLNLLTTIANF